MIVDGHTHLGLERFIVRPISEEKRKKPAFRDTMENDVASLLARMDANGVDRAVAFPFPLEEVDASLANAYVLEAAQAHPDRIIPFVLIGDDVERWIKAGAKGLKQHAILQSPERFDLPRAYGIAADAGVPLIIHARLNDGPSLASQINDIRKAAPMLTVIVAHMGRRAPNTATGVEENLLALRDDDRVLFETSTVRDSEIFARAVDIVGEDRVVFGSDQPFNSYLDPDPIAVELRMLREADLSADAQEKVLGGNILRCLGLQPEAASGGDP